MESLDVKGQFWSPNEPGQRVSGHLMFDPTDGGRLDLIGSLGDPYHPSRSDAGRLVGISSSTYYTLENCFFTNHTRAYGGVDSQTFHVGEVIIGATYGADEPLQFDELCLYLTNLLYWVEQSGIKRSSGSAPGRPSNVHTVTAELLEPVHVDLEDGKLSLYHFISESGNKMRASLEQDFYFRVQFDSVRSLAVVIDVASDLQDLVTIATCKTSGFERIILGSPDLEREIDGAKYRERVRLLAPWHAQPDQSSRQLSSRDMAFTFSEFGGMEKVKTWLDVAEQYRTMLSHVMNTRYAKKMFTDDRFLHRIAPLEALHKGWKKTGRKRISLRTRLLELADLAGPTFQQLVGDVDKWVGKVKNERDNIAHHGGRKLHQNSGELYYSAEAAYWLFVLCMLRQVDAPDGVFSHIGRNPQFVFAAEQIASMS